MTTPKTITFYEDKINEAAYKVGEKFEVVSKIYDTELNKIEIKLRKIVEED